MAYPFFQHRSNNASGYTPRKQDQHATARLLDLMADAELQQGHHDNAEALAWRAEALRAAVQS